MLQKKMCNIISDTKVHVKVEIILIDFKAHRER